MSVSAELAYELEKPAAIKGSDTWETFKRYWLFSYCVRMTSRQHEHPGMKVGGRAFAYHV